ncbi:MAG: hypothetical protein RLZZ423_354 [Cyanobacteriota bacterium]
MADPVVLAPDTRCGEHARALIAARVSRLVGLQAEVLADRDPEPLHQMRVSFRRLRSTLEQFAPALVLPDAADPERIARIGRRLGLSRDLDVLRQRLDQQLLPLLTDRERHQLKPLFKQLRRERRLAFEELTDALQGRRYLKLLAQLQAWLKAPRFTAMGEESLAAWRPELLQAVLAGLTTLPGWWAAGPYNPDTTSDLHRLRRRIKRARYGLSNLEPLDPMAFTPWIARLRRLQELLGDLNDLQLIEAALHRQLDGPADQLVPGLCSVLAEQRGQCWLLWSEQAEALHRPLGREALHALLRPEPDLHQPLTPP